MHKAVLLIGGNEGDRLDLISQTLILISALGNLVKVSSIYESQAWGGNSKGNFLNQAVILETSDTPEDLLRDTQKIEMKLGRKRHQHWGNRTMDIDLIYFDDRVFHTENLIVPHPLMSERRFVLVPLVEILPDLKHPVFGLSNQILLERCSDKSEVWLFG